MPTITAVYLERPATPTEVRDLLPALIGNFDVLGEALLAAITGRAALNGRLTFELPSSTAAPQGRVHRRGRRQAR